MDVRARLRLPSTVVACLFDLDGVLTKTAGVHAAAWKQMFDEFLRERATRAGEPFVPFDARRTTTTSTSTASRATTACASFLASRGIELPEGDAGRSARRGDGRRARQPQERARAAR